MSDRPEPFVSYNAKEILEKIERNTKEAADRLQFQINEAQSDIETLMVERIPPRIAELESALTWATRLIITQFVAIIMVAVYAALGHH